MTELDLLVQAITEDLDDPSDWGAPVEFRDSLALCALNSAYSLRGSSVQRYLARVLGDDNKLNPARTRQLLQLAAAKLTVEPRDLDRAKWLHESPSK
jgi:hypothetical protein